MTTRKLRTLWVCLPIGLSLSFGVFGCSGSDDSGDKAGGGGSGNTAGGSFDSGLSDSQSLGALTDAQATALCDKLATYYSSSAVTATLDEFGCKFTGLIGAAFSGATTDDAARAACKTGYDECKEAPSSSTQTCNKPSASCTATAAEFDACMNDSLAALQQTVNAIPACSTLTLMQLMDSGEDSSAEPSEPASCTTLKMKCPDAPAAPSPDLAP